jgi:outer membrane protein assembly factor BamB
MHRKLGLFGFAVSSALLLPTIVLGANDDWPRWRGPGRDGVARTDVPTEWTEGKSIAWKAEIPGRGHSSPVIWGDRLFVTTAVPTKVITGGAAAGRGPGGGAAAGIEHRHVVLCFDRKSGKKLWEQTAMTATPHEGYHQRYGSFASNSPVTDGKRLFAFFGSRGIYAYNLDGELLWKKEFSPMRMRNQFGEGSPTVLHDNVLLLKFDQEADSYLLALSADNGKELWRVTRDEVSSWSPPYVVTHAGRKQVIVSASTKVRSYDFQTGKLIWECAGLGTNVIPAPVVVDDIVIVMSGHREPNLLAIKLGRTGDLTGTDAIVWTNQRGNSYSASPVLHEGILYVQTDNGMLSAFDARTGKPYYHQQRLPKPYNFKASPIAAGGKLYLSTEEGDVIVVKLGQKFEVLATNTMPDEFFIASPAVAEGSLYLRGRNTLYCIRAN